MIRFDNFDDQTFESSNSGIVTIRYLLMDFKLHSWFDRKDWISFCSSYRCYSSFVHLISSTESKLFSVSLYSVLFRSRKIIRRVISSLHNFSFPFSGLLKLSSDIHNHDFVDSYDSFFSTSSFSFVFSLHILCGGLSNIKGYFSFFEAMFFEAMICSTWSGVNPNFAILAEALIFSFFIHLVCPSFFSLLRSFVQRFITFGIFFPDLLVFLWGFWWECSGFPDWFLDGMRTSIENGKIIVRLFNIFRKVCKRLVGFSHLVRIFLLFHSISLIRVCGKDFFWESERHWCSLFRSWVVDDPFTCVKEFFVVWHFNWDLIDRSSNSFGLNHHLRRSIFNCCFPDRHRIYMSVFLDISEHISKDLSCCDFLPVKHNIVDKLFDVFTRWWKFELDWRF